MTENHNYNTPSKGTTDWHAPLNDNFSALDRDVPITDTAANKGNYTPADGAIFVATDTGARFYGDGTQWVEIPPPQGAGDGIQESGDGGGDSGGDGSSAYAFDGTGTYPIDITAAKETTLSEVQLIDPTEQNLLDVQAAIESLYQ